MRVTVCQLPDSRDRFDAAWARLCAHTRAERSELVLLPEMPFAAWFATVRAVDLAVWRAAVEAHRRWEERVRELGAPFVIGTRPVDHGTRRLNEAFLATPDRSVAVHHKRYLPDEEGFWEASWYDAGDGTFDPVDAGGACVGAQICTELWMLDESRRYGMRGADIIVVPRATSATTRDQWVVGGRAAAIVSGAYCLSSNRCDAGTAGVAFAGHAWIIDPDGDLMALTSDAEPFLTREIDVERARAAKATYPRYVR